MWGVGGRKKQDAAGGRLRYPEVGFAPAPPPPPPPAGAGRAGEIIPAHLLLGLSGFTCRPAERRGGGGDRPAAPGAAGKGGDAGGTLGDHGTVYRASLRRPPMRSASSAAQAGAAGCAGGRACAGPVLRWRWLVPAPVPPHPHPTPVSACTPRLRLHPPSPPPPSFWTAIPTPGQARVLEEACPGSASSVRSPL